MMLLLVLPYLPSEATLVLYILDQPQLPPGSAQTVQSCYSDETKVLPIILCFLCSLCSRGILGNN